MKVFLTQHEFNCTSKVFSPLAIPVKHKCSSSPYMSHSKKVWRLWKGFLSAVRRGTLGGGKQGAHRDLHALMVSQAVHEAWCRVCRLSFAAGVAAFLEAGIGEKGANYFLCFRLSAFHDRLLPVALTVKLLDTSSYMSLLGHVALNTTWRAEL